MAEIGGLDQAEKEFDKDVLEIKSLVNKIGDLSKITFKQKNNFYMMKAIISLLHFMQN